MTIVEVRASRTRYSLTASRNSDGALVLAGSDVSGWVKDMFSTDAYDYFYVVKARDVKRVCTALGTGEDTLFERIRELLSPHGTGASDQWKVWLDAQGIPYEFSVWR